MHLTKPRGLLVVGAGVITVRPSCSRGLSKSPQVLVNFDKSADRANDDAASSVCVLCFVPSALRRIVKCWCAAERVAASGGGQRESTAVPSCFLSSSDFVCFRIGVSFCIA